MEGEAPTADAAASTTGAPASTAAAAMARGALCFALGGGAAALLDWLRARGELAHLLPEGGGRLVAFLLGLYGGAGAALGLLLGLALWALRRAGALTPLRRPGSSTEPGDGAGEGAPLPALLLGAAIAAAAYGAVLYGPALLCLLRFHHRPLIALLVGAVAAALLLPAAAAAALLAAGLRRLPGLSVLGRGPRLLRPVDGALGLYALGWAAALVLTLGAVAALMLHLQGRPRMNAPLRALNLALLAPPIAVAAAALGEVLGRLLGRAGRGLGPWASTAGGALLLAGVGLALPALLFGAAYWDTLRVLDLRPLTSFSVAVLAALGLGLRRPRRVAMGAAALWPLMLLPLLWGAALGLGRGDRVRKAALSQAPLAAPLVSGLQAALDLDRDGYPSRWVVGGSDCDDLDPSVHPGAFDWPGDGVDQNCNGHEAALPREGAPPWPAAPPGLPERPSVVLITVDALRADHVGAYGYGRPTTPALDALAHEGVLFEGAFAHAPSTRYSVPAILTGRYPSTIAWGPPAQHWPPEVLPENRLLAEMLKERGYRTTALLSYHYFEPTWGLAQGFDDYDYHLMSLHSLGGDPAATSGTSARELADLAIGKLAALPPESPYFLWVHFYDPHYRYEHHGSAPTFGDGAREQDQYDNEIRYTDDHIGRLLAALRARPDWGRTAVVVTADHGEGFGEHGIPKDKRHGYHLYADQTKVPLILRVPGLPPRRVTAPAGHVDLAPTILQLVGGRAEDEPQLLGGPLLGAAAGDGAERQVFQEVMYEGPTVRKALVTRRFHFIRNVIPDGTAELFDLQGDPQELVDLQGAPQVAADEADLSRRLAAWMDESALPRDFARRVAGNLSRAPLPAQRPVGARLGDLLEVVGVDVETPQVLAGGSARFAVIFKALRRVPPGWRLFMHLRRPDGRFTNLDHDPIEGLLPLQQLQAGQYLRDVVAAPVPKSWDRGPFQVDLGLFRGGERAEVQGPAPLVDAALRVVHAATLEVQ